MGAMWLAHMAGTLCMLWGGDAASGGAAAGDWQKNALKGHKIAEQMQPEHAITASRSRSRRLREPLKEAAVKTAQRIST